MRRITSTSKTMIQFFIEIHKEKKYVLHINGYLSQSTYCCCGSFDSMDYFQPDEKDHLWILTGSGKSAKRSVSSRVSNPWPCYMCKALKACDIV
jgi:hypothetical protein